MSGDEKWCGEYDAHPQHWLRKGLRCDGVTPEAATVMAVEIEMEPYCFGAMSRDEANKVVAALEALHD